MTPLHFTFDLDDVIGAFNVELCRHLSVMLGDPAIIDDHQRWTRYEIDEFYPQVIDFAAVFTAMDEDGSIERIAPKPRIVELMRLLHSRGHRITILTARGWMRDGETATARWLSAHEVPHDDLIISPYRVSKEHFIPRDTSIYFDDNGHHIIDCAKHCHAAVLLHKPWNSQVDIVGHSNVYRVVDPDDVPWPINIERWFDALSRKLLI